MDVMSIGIWVVFNVIVIVSGFSFKNTPTCLLSSKVILLGKNLTIDCSTTDANSTSTLYHNDKPIYSKTAPVYHIHIDTNADGVYKCVAKSQTGQTITWKCNVYPYNPIKLETPKIDSRSEYPSGHSFNLTCHIKNDGGAKLDFGKSDSSSGNINQPITIRSTLSVTLMFKNPSAMPKTRYTCAHSRDGVQMKTYADISIKDPTPVRIIDFPAGASIVLKPLKRTFMSCHAIGFPKPTLTWFKNGKELQPYTKSRNCTNGKNVKCFVIKSPTYPKDEGNYSCVARNELGSWSTKSITALFQFPPEIDDSSKETVIVQGMMPKSLTCTIVKTKRQILPTFKWIQSPCISPKDCKAVDNWLPVAADHNQRPPPDNPTATSTVTVPKTVLNAMSYKCIATSILGNDSRIITFLRSKVTKPKVEIEGRVVFNAEGVLNLSCVVSGPVNYARWTKNGRKIHPSRNPRVSIRRHTNKDMYSEIVTLTIVNATINDSGVYACKVKPGGSRFTAEKVVTVKALYRPKIISLPNITVSHSTKGETNIELTCNVTSNPKPDITWNKLGSSLPALQEKENCDDMVSGYYLKRTSEGTGHVLLICDPDYRFTGWYTCKAQNKEGTDVKSAYVNIQSAPNIISDSSYKIIYSTIGQTVDISCQATGNPSPTVTWTKRAANGSIVAMQEKSKRVSSVRMRISKLQKDDFGNYTCVATNSIGTDKMVVNVKARAVPTKFQGAHTQTIILASGIGGAIAFVFIIAVLACCLMYRRQDRLLKQYKAIKYLRSGEDYKLDPNRTILEQCEELPYDADWEFPVKQLILQGVVGSGTFGQVMKAEAIGILSFSARDKTSDAFKRRSRLRRRLSSSRIYQDSTGNDYTRTTVAVKMLKAESSESDYKDLATELKIMIHLGEHTNIINLLGACTRTKQLMVIMEFAPHGNLLNFLRSRREIYEATWRKTANDPDVEFTLADLVMYSYQIARGMDFLSSKKCVHRDLASRNILIGEDYVMKIADFGLARDIYKSDLYVKETTGLLPVKWMAPESLFDRVYTHKTDVWSFGVVLWEMQTLGGTPYPGIPVEELMDYLSEGKRMRQPMDCPLEMYAIMRDCWLHKPSERPAFSELVRRIERIIEKKISGQGPDEAYISVFMDEDLHRIYYLEPKDTFKDASQGSIPREDNLQSMTEEEIQASPLPPVPCLSLENIYKSTQDNNDQHYFDPVDHNTDTRYVQSPLSTTSSPGKDRGNIFDYQNLRPSPIRSISRAIGDHEKRVSACSTGVESGIEMDETINDHSLGRRKPCDGRHGLARSFDVEPRTSLLDSSVIKGKTKETLL